MLFLRVFLQSIPALVSFLLEFTGGNPDDEKKNTKYAGIAIAIILLVIGYVSNVAISLTKENEALKTSTSTASKRIKTLESELSNLKRAKQDTDGTNTRLGHDLDDERAEHAACKMREMLKVAAGHQTPAYYYSPRQDEKKQDIPEKKVPEAYKIPNEILAILGGSP